MTILLVCVNYNSDVETTEYLKIWSRLPRVRNLRVVVVDNSEKNQPYDPSPMLEDLEVSVVKPKQNLGYYGGAALGFDQYLKEYPLPEWTIVSNVDLRPCNNPLEGLAKFGEMENLGVLAPAVYSELTGANQNPYMANRPGRFRMHAYRFMFRSYGFYLAYESAAHFFRRLRFRRSNSPSALEGTMPIPIYAPHGSCVIFSREFFRRGGSLHYPSFLFGEEIFVAEQARNLNLKVLYTNDLRFSHIEHVSTRAWRSRKLVRYAHESATYCAKTYFQ